MYDKFLRLLELVFSVDYTNEINFAIDKYIEGYGIEDEDFAFDKILSLVKKERIANQIYVFIPVALTREWYKNHPVKLHDYYSRVNGKSSSENVKFKSISVYNQIEKVFQKRLNTLSEEDIMKILACSAEHKIIVSMVEQGSKLENLRFAPLASEV
jgi:hypothetical protein